MSKTNSMNTARWEQMVEKVVKKYKTQGITRVTFTPEAVVKLLARQHRAMARNINKLTRYDVSKDYYENQQFLGIFTDGAYVRLDDVLAALAKQGGKK